MDTILVANAGSSSVKFQVFGIERTAASSARSRARWTESEAARGCASRRPMAPCWSTAATRAKPSLMCRRRSPTAGGWLRDELKIDPIAIGHRVVHGGPDYDRPVRVDQDVLARLERYVSLAPLHQPYNLAPIRSILAVSRICRRSRVSIPPFIAATARWPIISRFPWRCYAEGVRRYGFHGLSYEYIASILPEIAPDIASKRVIVAHLGSGASMCAISGGRSIESSLGFTALDGLPMGTRPRPDRSGRRALPDFREGHVACRGPELPLPGVRPQGPVGHQQRHAGASKPAAIRALPLRSTISFTAPACSRECWRQPCRGWMPWCSRPGSAKIPHRIRRGDRREAGLARRFTRCRRQRKTRPPDLAA